MSHHKPAKTTPWTNPFTMANFTVCPSMKSDDRKKATESNPKIVRANT